MEVKLETGHQPAFEGLPTLDLRSEEFNTRPYEVLRRLRAQSPLAVSHRGLEILRYKGVDKALSTPSLRVYGGITEFDHAKAPLLADWLVNGKLLEMEPDRHAIAKRVMMRAFGLKKIDERVDFMQDYANSLIDKFIDSGNCNFIDDFSDKFPIYVACSLFGVDAQDVPVFTEATKHIHLQANYPVEPHLPVLENALKTLWEYGSQLMKDRARNPRQDFVTSLIEAQKIDGKLTESELVWNFVNLLFAGHDTTRTSLAHILVAMSESPGAWERIRAEPHMIAQAVREGQRYYPIVQAHTRVSLEPYDIEGVTLLPNTRMMLNRLCRNSAKELC